MEIIRRTALVGLHCRTSYGHRTSFHLMIPSYVADIQECEALLCVIHGSRSTLLCHNCPISKSDSSSNKHIKRKTLSGSPRLLCERALGSKLAMIRFASFLCFLFLYTFLLINVQRSVHVYALIRFKALHCLHLDFLKLLNNRRYNYLLDIDKYTTVV